MKNQLTTAGLLSLVLLAGCGRTEAPDPDEPSAGRLAAMLDTDLKKIRVEAESLSFYINGLYLRRDTILPQIDRSRYTVTANGVFHKATSEGGAAWISAQSPITDEMRDVAYLTEPADQEFKRICQEFPEISQVYYNDRHSLCRIYPWIDAVVQYPSRMNVPEFNFYYLADAEYNPQRRGVWVTEPYIEPAGRGWMVSALAPVYVNDRLEGVVGLDLALVTIINHYFKSRAHPVAVISRGGVLVAATEAAVRVMEMPPLKEHKYLETVKHEMFKPDDYNIRKSTLRPVRAIAAALLDKGVTRVELTVLENHYTVHAAPVAELGWTVIEFIKQ